ncbi:hypothetical protein FQA39_LY06026 [Lamprigera yunnana]|nr:hypothetical protein FQA39_LY06026 [Lamprigera yunnana]
MMKAIGVLFIFGFFTGALGSCAFILDENGKECADPHKFTSDQILRFYHSGYSSTEAPIINLFVECLWKKWGFLDNNGNIKYDNIKNTDISVFFITGVCEDTHLSPKSVFVAAVEDCRINAPVHVRAETIRSCISQRYKEFLQN